MNSQQIVLEYNQRWQEQLKAFRGKLLIFASFIAFVILMLVLAWNVESIGRELVFLTFTAPMILVGLIIYDLQKSSKYVCPNCSVSLTHKNPFTPSRKLKACPEGKVEFC